MNLEILSIEGSPNLTDDALRYLAGMRELRDLDIYNSRITEAGLAHLYPLKGLNSIRIKTTSPISRLALSRLKTELPSLRTLEVPLLAPGQGMRGQ